MDLQAEKTRKRLALAAAAALLLLRKRRNSLVDAGVSAGLPIPLIGQKLRSGLVVSIAESRTYARAAGLKRLRSEIISADLDLVVARATSVAQSAQDLYEARLAADRYAKRWEKKAQGDTVAEAADAASAETAGALRRTAVTETSEAFNETRLSEARSAAGDAEIGLFRRWDAKSDSCPECAELDGTIVGVDEDFPGGEPGSIHPSCCCTWELLTAEEANRTNSGDEAA